MYFEKKLIVYLSATLHHHVMSFPGFSDSKESACRFLDLGSKILGSRRCLGNGNGNTLQYSCLENSMDRGAWWATVYGFAKSQT